MNGDNEEPILEGDTQDEKKLSKGQLKKLKEKEKAKKQAEEEAAAKAKAEADAATAQTNSAAGTQEKGDAQDEGDDNEDDKDGGAGGAEGTKGLSKGQLKKLKEKQKKEGKGGEEKKEEEDQGKGDAKDKKKAGKKGGVAELVKKRLEEQKKLEEEIRKLEEEARAKEEEERRREEEEQRKQKEIDEERRKKKNEKKDLLKKEGKYMTKAQRDAQAALEARRKELIEQGIIQADAPEGEEDNAGKPKSIAVRTRKPKHNKDANKQEEAKEQEQKAQEKEPETKKVEDFDDWEAELESNNTVRPPGESDKPEEESWETFDPNAGKKTEEVTKPKDKPVKVERREAPKVQEKPKDAPVEKKEDSATEHTPVTEGRRDPKKAAEEAKEVGPDEKIRSPIICILGHVDTGKTKLLDNMRSTNVQEGEAGGITQQIGATFFPYEKLQKEIVKTAGHYPVDIQVPGLLIIDTPGHESFSNLRSRGSGLCDIAILVVDIMHGLEKQTLESIELLKFRKTPFVIALNKIDRIYGWKPKKDTSSFVSLKKQEKTCQLEFRDRCKGIVTELTEKGFNVALYYDNPDPNNYVSIIPTSAMSGEGISDLLSVGVNLTQKWLRKKITKKEEFKCTVLEVKVIEGLGASIDVMLVDGTMKEGDKIVIAGYDGPIVTTVRALLTPHPMKEMRVKNEYIHHRQISGAMGIKVSANDLDKALAGSELYIARSEEEEENYKKLLEEEIIKVKKSIKLVEEGVLVAASTLGSLEALLQFLKTSNIPVSTISIGPVSKAEVIKAMKPLQIVEGEVKKEYATILAFDVKVLPDAKELAEQENVKIFTANIIYHLFDHFTAYIQELKEEKKRNEGKLAVFPCVLKPVAFFNMKDPIVMGIDVVEGQLRMNTPLAVIEKGRLRIGVVESMEKEHKPLQVVRPSDGSVAIKIRGDSTILAGRHFELKDRLVSIVNRESIDALKKYFRDEMSKGDWELIKKLKTAFNVI